MVIWSTYSGGEQVCKDIDGELVNPSNFRDIEGNLQSIEGVKGLYIDPYLKILFIQSGINISKGKGVYPAVYLSFSEISKTIDDDYLVNYINLYDWTNDPNDWISLASHIEKIVNKKIEKKSFREIFERINEKGVTDLVCLIVDSVLDGKSVILNGNFTQCSALDLIFYALRCLPKLISNSLIINTNIRLDKISDDQFISYTNENLNKNEQGENQIYINSSSSIIEYHHFYSLYLKMLIKKRNTTLNGIFVNARHENIKGYIGNLDVIAANALLDGKDEKEICKRIVELSKETQDLINFINNRLLSDKHRKILNKWLMKNDIFKFFSVYIDTKLDETFSFADTDILCFSRPTADDLKNIKEFYKKNCDNENAVKFIKKVFKKCAIEIQTYDDELFKIVYDLKTLLKIEIKEMNYYFINYAHEKYRLLMIEQYEEFNRKNKFNVESETRKSANAKKNTFLSTIKDIIYGHCIITLIPIIIGCLLFTLPDKIWAYLAIITRVNSWNIKLYIFIILVFLTLIFYVIPYALMRKNTVHLNGFSNEKSIKVSSVCILAILIPTLLYVCLTLFL